MLHNGIRADPRGFTGACVAIAQAWCARLLRLATGMVCKAGVDPEWSHNMAYALALDARTWPGGDVPGLGLIDKDVDLLRG